MHALFVSKHAACADAKNLHVIPGQIRQPGSYVPACAPVRVCAEGARIVQLSGWLQRQPSQTPCSCQPQLAEGVEEAEEAEEREEAHTRLPALACASQS